MADIETLMKHNKGGELNPIQTQEDLVKIIRSSVYSKIYVSPAVYITSHHRFEAESRNNQLIIMKGSEAE